MRSFRPPNKKHCLTVFFVFCRRNFNISAVRPSGANIFLLSPAVMRADKRRAGDNTAVRELRRDRATSGRGRSAGTARMIHYILE